MKFGKTILGNVFKDELSYNIFVGDLMSQFEVLKKDLSKLLEARGITFKISPFDKQDFGGGDDPYLWCKLSDNGNLEGEGNISIENQESLYDDFTKIVRKHSNDKVKFAWGISGIGNLIIKPFRAGRKVPFYMTESKSFLENYENFSKQVLK